jgi:hypothetical protein
VASLQVAFGEQVDVRLESFDLVLEAQELSGLLPLHRTRLTPGNVQLYTLARALLPKMVKDPASIKPSDWVDNAEMADPSDEKPAGYDDIPAKIPDPNAKKPEDWDENEKIDDPADSKPEGWDDIPKEIADPKANKPEDWNTEDDGEWAAPMISNPEYKGEWRAKRIPNPAYKGIWVAPDIANPDFVDDADLYNVVTDGAHVGFEIQQGKSGTVFDNILIADSEEDASAAFAKIKPLMDAEKKAKDDADAEERKKAEDARKAAEEEKKNEKADKEDDDEEEKKAEL